MEIEDVISLSVTSPRFLSLGWEHIRDYYISYMGRWAGQSIFCAGDFSAPDKYPPGMFTLHEESEMVRFRHVGYKKVTSWDHMAILQHTRLEIHPFYSTKKINHLISHALLSQEWVERLPSYEAGQVLSGWKLEDSTFYPTDQPWMLRNLTTKEFVRSEAIAVKPEYIQGPIFRSGVSFGDVLIYRTSWGPWGKSSFGRPSEVGSFHRGVWAGHSFDIIPLARHTEETNAEEWNDSSEEVSREVSSIWEDCGHKR